MSKQISKAIVFHADILGFKEIIQKSENDINDETLTVLKNALDEAVKLFKHFDFSEISAVTTTFRHKIFSDNLYASFSYNEDEPNSCSQALLLAVIFARSYYSVMLDNQLPIRGAISFGNDYSDDNIIFSAALVKAYLLESEKAIYPRIIIDDTLFDKVKHNITVSGPYMLRMLNSSFLRDDSGIYFLSPSGLSKDFDIGEEGFSPYELYKGFIKRDIDFSLDVLKRMEESGNSKVASKYKWLAAILMWEYCDRAVDTGYKFEEIKFSKLS